MTRSCRFTFTAIAAALMLVSAWPVAAREIARGIVFHDLNANSLRDADEPGLPDIRVSNGVQIVLTDADGAYELPVSGDANIFVIKPSGWAPPLTAHNTPAFYYIHRPDGSPELEQAGVAPTGPLPESIDFPLIERPEPDRFRALFFGDTQVRNITEVEYVCHDVLEEIRDNGLADAEDMLFGVTLGDIVFDDLQIMEPLRDAIGTVGLPWYNVLGNHDMNYDTPGDEFSTETFARVFGPPTYSFEIGKVHFVALDDVIWEGDKYHGGLSEKDLAFLRNDIALTPEDYLVVLLMHIPISNTETREAVFDILSEREHTFSASAHAHVQAHQFLGADAGWKREEPHHHLIAGTVCGPWWQGVKDERGIPHATMPDGAPNGYLVFTFDGADYSFEFKAASRPAEYQMAIHLPEEVPAAALADTDALVNVFAGSERSTVQMRIGDDARWIPLEHVMGRKDPAFERMKALEEHQHDAMGPKLPNPADVTHMWAGMLPAGIAPGTHALEVRTTDLFGQVYTASRIFRVK